MAISSKYCESADPSKFLHSNIQLLYLIWEIKQYLFSLNKKNIYFYGEQYNNNSICKCVCLCVYMNVCEWDVLARPEDSVVSKDMVVCHNDVHTDKHKQAVWCCTNRALTRLRRFAPFSPWLTFFPLLSLDEGGFEIWKTAMIRKYLS